MRTTVKINILIFMLICLTGCTGMNTMNSHRTSTIQGNSADLENNIVKPYGKNAKENIYYLPIVTRIW